MEKSKTRAKIMISGYYGFNNTGDEAILKSMVRAFKEKIPRIKYSRIQPERAGVYYITWD
jgi:polysaccharide pyruvyl transferase WcaK-like protein